VDERPCGDPSHADTFLVGRPQHRPHRPEAKRAAAGTVVRTLPRSQVEWLVADHDVHAHRPDEVAALILDSTEDGHFPG
jgi:hypothetical protein